MQNCSCWNVPQIEEIPELAERGVLAEDIVHALGGRVPAIRGSRSGRGRAARGGRAVAASRSGTGSRGGTGS